MTSNTAVSVAANGRLFPPRGLSENGGATVEVWWKERVEKLGRWQLTRWWWGGGMSGRED